MSHWYQVSITCCSTHSDGPLVEYFEVSDVKNDRESVIGGVGEGSAVQSELCEEGALGETSHVIEAGGRGKRVYTSGCERR